MKSRKKIVVQWSKYERKEVQKSQNSRSLATVHNTNKVLRPTVRDERTYREALTTSKIPEVIVPTDVELEKGLQHAYIGYFKEDWDLQKTKRELETKGIDSLAMCRFDSLSCVITKFNVMEKMSMNNTCLDRIKNCFQKLSLGQSLWSKLSQENLR